jgi:Kef-type K+ transport system membrane component KefB
MNSLFAVGALIISGFFGGLLARRIRFPTISGYIVTGMILSSSVLGIISKEMVGGKLTVVTDLALGIIAYLVGGSLNLNRLKELKKSIFWITLFEGLGAMFFTFLVVGLLSPFLLRLNANFFQTYLPMAILLAAISLPTAPAATVAIVREYKAEGPLTQTLLGVVALDDALAIICYALAAGVAGSFVVATKSIHWATVLVNPLIEILGALFLGLVLGFALIQVVRFVRKRQELLILVLGTILLGSGLAKILHLSPLLLNMSIGFIVINRMKYSEQMFSVISDIEDVIFALFFTLAGAHFDLKVLKVAGILAILIVLGRCAGKFAGARLGANFAGSSETVKKYLGFGLLPKAGVTVGLIFLAKDDPQFQIIGNLMVNGVLASVIINELIAPPLTKYALFKSGEAKEK